MQYTVFNDENTRASKIDSVPFPPSKGLCLGREAERAQIADQAHRSQPESM